MQTCAMCAEPLPKRKQKYCSTECYLKAFRQSEAYIRGQAKRNSQPRQKVPRTCAACLKVWQVERHSPARHCSMQCAKWTRPRFTRLPKNHPVMVLQRPPVVKPAKSKAYAWRTPRECPGCAGIFCPIFTPTTVTCSKRCARRTARWRRRASEANAPGSFTWSDFMRMAYRFNFHCAYCGEKPIGQLDPDHVVPLSRGGSNGITNILPACRQCNSDKRDLLLHEWAQDRATRGKEPRITTWRIDDPRVQHLTVSQPALAA